MATGIISMMGMLINKQRDTSVVHWKQLLWMEYALQEKIKCFQPWRCKPLAKRFSQGEITGRSKAYHCLISSSFFLKFSSFFRPFTFCCCRDSSLSHVLWMYDQPFHLIRYWTSPSSFSGSKSALGLPLASVAYTVVEAPVAAKEIRLQLVPLLKSTGHELH